MYTALNYILARETYILSHVYESYILHLNLN